MVEKKADEKGMSIKKAENFSEWYIESLLKSGFMDYSDVSGAMVFRPISYGMWELFSREVDSEFKKVGIENVYFPIFIPEKLLKKETSHFEGFTPEVAWVTQTGNEKLSERLAVRPTSEAIMYPSFAKWIRSWRDLPIKYNQWNNAVRWEFKHPTPLLRSREFLWNEGHSAYATEQEALAEKDVILNIYLKALRELFALPGIAGQKTDKEKFAGALASYSIEHIMPDGWAIQGPAWHFDGQNFAKMFDIKFLDINEKEQYAWQNTYAVSTREMGVVLASHGDDKGIVLPPKVAYIQVVIVPILKKGVEEKVLEYAISVERKLEKLRVKLDARDGYTPGFKFNEWELKGVPVRIEVGPKDMEAGSVTIVRRDTSEKEVVKVDNANKRVHETLDLINKNLYEKAHKFLESHIHYADSYEELKKLIAGNSGIVSASWCGMVECEDKVKEETSAKITNIPFEQKKKAGKCIICGMDSKSRANFARSY